jgi:hypothetical protein
MDTYINENESFKFNHPLKENKIIKISEKIKNGAKPRKNQCRIYS